MKYNSSQKIYQDACELKNRFSLFTLFPIKLLFSCIFIYFFSCLIIVLLRNTHKQNTIKLKNLHAQISDQNNAYTVLNSKYDVMTSIKGIKNILAKKKISLVEIKLDSIVPIEKIFDTPNPDLILASQNQHNE